jgi:DNA-binding response OmpR family regulator
MSFNPRPRVLYVDNHADSGEMMTELLSFQNIETRVAATASQALALIKAECFDLYILEAWLPDLDGFELCQRMRVADPKTPVLFFSGAAYEADKKRGLEAGAEGYVSKPDIDELVGKIDCYFPYAMAAA